MLVSSDQFKKFPEGSDTFFVVRECSEPSQSALILPSGSEKLPKVILVVFWRSRDVLRFLDVMWGILMEFWKVLEGSERIVSILRCSSMFFGNLRHSNSFWGVLMDSERFYNYCPFRFWDVLRHSEVFCYALMGSGEFKRIPEGFEVFSDVREFS